MTLPFPACPPTSIVKSSPRLTTRFNSSPGRARCEAETSPARGSCPVRAAALGVILYIANTRSQEPLAGGRIPIPVRTACGPTTTLQEAASTVDFQLLAAQSDLANNSNVDRVELCESGAIAIWYESGVAVFQEHSTLANPEAEWDQLAKDYDEFSVGTVRGLPASLAEPGIVGSEGGVDLVENGIRITISGDGKIPLEDLITITGSLSPVIAPTPSPSH
jgi:hypothetical protein